MVKKCRFCNAVNKGTGTSSPYTFGKQPETVSDGFIKCQYTDDYLLTCVQLGISIADLDLLTIGLVNDMFTERQNDGYSYKELASQSDFDRF